MCSADLIAEIMAYVGFKVRVKMTGRKVCNISAKVTVRL